MDRIKTLFGKYRPKIILGVVAVVALSLPFVINQVLKQQDLRQRADSAPAITFTLSPATKTLGVGEMIDVDLLMDAGANDIGSLEFKVKYNSFASLLQFIDVVAQPTGLQVANKQDSSGDEVITMLNPGVSPVTGNSLKVVTLRFKALAAGASQVALNPADIKATAASAILNQFVPIGNTTGITGTYTISSTGTVDCTSNTGRPNDCSCALNSQCSSNHCDTGGVSAPNAAGNIGINGENGTCTSATTIDANSFDFNNGKNHCRPNAQSCETALGETAVSGSNCSTYLGTPARTCSASNGYTTGGVSTISACSTISSDGFVQYCLPTTKTTPSGWTEVSTGNSACSTYNEVASKCYKSTFPASGTINPNLDSSLTAPTNLQPNGNIIPGLTALTWTASDKATGGYTIKITDDAIADMKDLNDDCVHATETPLPTTGGVCRNITGTTYQYNFQPGHHYHWFLHSRNTTGKYGPPVPAIVYADPNGDATLIPPTNLKPSGTIQPGLTTLTWDNSPKSTGGYYIRITDTASLNAKDLGDDCANQKANDTNLPTTGGVCRITPGNSYSYNFLAGHSYIWFVHTRASDAKFGPATASINVTAEAANPPVNMCTATNSRPTDCACDNNNQCRSTLCTSNKCAPKPTGTIPQGHAGIIFSVVMPGIGQKLDNNEDNQNPKNSSRIAYVNISNSSNAVIGNGSDGIPLAFNPLTYKYEGALDLGAQFLTGSYTVKLDFDNTLHKSIPGIVSIQQGQAGTSTATIKFVPGDINRDNTIDIQDYNNFMACFRNEAICTADMAAMADFNDNGQVDALDRGILLRGFATRNGD